METSTAVFGLFYFMVVAHLLARWSARESHEGLGVLSAVAAGGAMGCALLCLVQIS